METITERIWMAPRTWNHLGDLEYLSRICSSQRTSKVRLSPYLALKSLTFSEWVDDTGKNDLALYLGDESGLAVFRNQDLGNKRAQFSKEFGVFWSLHVHQVSRAEERRLLSPQG